MFAKIRTSSSCRGSSSCSLSGVHSNRGGLLISSLFSSTASSPSSSPSPLVLLVIITALTLLLPIQVADAYCLRFTMIRCSGLNDEDPWPKGDNDPIAKITMPGLSEHSTHEVGDTNSPTWNKVWTFCGFHLYGSIRIKIIDSDWPDGDDHIGTGYHSGMQNLVLNQDTDYSKGIGGGTCYYRLRALDYGTPCTNSVNCNNHASSVSGTHTIGCTCTCTQNSHQSWRYSTCSACSSGYTGYPNCYRICTNSDDCNNRATAVSGTTGSGCSCTCRHDMMRAYSGGACQNCATGYELLPNCWRRCTSFHDCTDHAASVTGNVNTGCGCTCRYNYAGTVCDRCQIGFSRYHKDCQTDTLTLSDTVETFSNTAPSLSFRSRTNPTNTYTPPSSSQSETNPTESESLSKATRSFTNPSDSHTNPTDSHTNPTHSPTNPTNSWTHTLTHSESQTVSVSETVTGGTESLSETFSETFSETLSEDTESVTFSETLSYTDTYGTESVSMSLTETGGTESMSMSLSESMQPTLVIDLWQYNVSRQITNVKHWLQHPLPDFNWTSGTTPKHGLDGGNHRLLIPPKRQQSATTDHHQMDLQEAAAVDLEEQQMAYRRERDMALLHFADHQQQDQQQEEYDQQQFHNHMMDVQQGGGASGSGSDSSGETPPPTLPPDDGKNDLTQVLAIGMRIRSLQAQSHNVTIICTSYTVGWSPVVATVSQDCRTDHKEAWCHYDTLDVWTTRNVLFQYAVPHYYNDSFLLDCRAETYGGDTFNINITISPIRSEVPAAHSTLSPSARKMSSIFSYDDQWFLCIDAFVWGMVAWIFFMIVGAIYSRFAACCEEPEDDDDNGEVTVDTHRHIGICRSLMLNHMWLQLLIPCHSECVYAHVMQWAAAYWFMLMCITALARLTYFESNSNPWVYAGICGFVGSLFTTICRPMFTFYYWAWKPDPDSIPKQKAKKKRVTRDLYGQSATDIETCSHASGTSSMGLKNSFRFNAVFGDDGGEAVESYNFDLQDGALDLNEDMEIGQIDLSENQSQGNLDIDNIDIEGASLASTTRNSRASTRQSSRRGADKSQKPAVPMSLSAFGGAAPVPYQQQLFNVDVPEDDNVEGAGAAGAFDLTTEVAALDDADFGHVATSQKIEGEEGEGSNSVFNKISAVDLDLPVNEDAAEVNDFFTDAAPAANGSNKKKNKHVDVFGEEDDDEDGVPQIALDLDEIPEMDGEYDATFDKNTTTLGEDDVLEGTTTLGAGAPPAYTLEEDRVTMVGTIRANGGDVVNLDEDIAAERSLSFTVGSASASASGTKGGTMGATFALGTLGTLGALSEAPEDEELPTPRANSSCFATPVSKQLKVAASPSTRRGMTPRDEAPSSAPMSARTQSPAATAVLPMPGGGGGSHSRNQSYDGDQSSEDVTSLAVGSNSTKTSNNSKKKGGMLSPATTGTTMVGSTAFQRQTEAMARNGNSRQLSTSGGDSSKSGAFNRGGTIHGLRNIEKFMDEWDEEDDQDLDVEEMSLGDELGNGDIFDDTGYDPAYKGGGGNNINLGLDEEIEMEEIDESHDPSTFGPPSTVPAAADGSKYVSMNPRSIVRPFRRKGHLVCFLFCVICLAAAYVIHSTAPPSYASYSPNEESRTVFWCDHWELSVYLGLAIDFGFTQFLTVACAAIYRWTAQDPNEMAQDHHKAWDSDEEDDEEEKARKRIDRERAARDPFKKQNGHFAVRWLKSELHPFHGERRERWTY